jgi:Coenzyme PQQ synthesis protein D (PqqD)
MISSVASTLRLRSEELEWRDVEGEVVALDLRTSAYLAVNESGAKLWSALASGASRDELIDLLVRTFELPREQATTDVDAFIEMLARQDMLVEE